MGGRLRKVKGEIWVQMKKKKEKPKKKRSTYLFFLRTGNYWRLRVHKNKERNGNVFLQRDEV